MSDKPIPHLPTAGMIAEHLQVSLHRVQYILRTRKHIKPSAYGGILRLYDSKAIAQVRHELNAIEARKSDR